LRHENNWRFAPVHAGERAEDEKLFKRSVVYFRDKRRGRFTFFSPLSRLTFF